MTTMDETTPKAPSEFEKVAAEADKESLLSEFWSFLAHNKKWWLLPIVIVMLLLGTLIFLSGTAVTPFIYTLF
jgi:Family of unknown function (DUF5989)